jgi:hypothetical protein
LVQQLNDTTIAVVFPDTLTVSTSSPKYIKVYSLSSCDTSLAKSISLTRTVVAAPTAITITALQTNLCGARKYRYTAPSLPTGALGYVWSFEGSLFIGSGTIDSGNVNSRVLTVTYTSNAASAAGDSVRLLYTTGCGNSASKSAKLSNTALSVPAAPTAITITAIQTNVCGARRYRYSAPALPIATTTTGEATGYVWTIIGTLGTPAIDSGSLTSRTFTATFASNAAAGVGDSVRVLYTSGCGNSLRKASKLSNTALAVPAAPASVTIQQVLPCLLYTSPSPRD